MGSKSGVCAKIIRENLCWERSKAGNTSQHQGSPHMNLLRREGKLMGKPDKHQNGNGNWYFQCFYQIPDKPELFPPLQEEQGLGRVRQEALMVWWALMPTGQPKILSLNTGTDTALHSGHIYLGKHKIPSKQSHSRNKTHLTAALQTQRCHWLPCNHSQNIINTSN